MVLDKWFILIFAKPANCKSLEQARLSEKLFEEYHKVEKKYPNLPHRILLTNQRLSDKLTKIELEHGHLKYWNEPEEFRYCPRINCWRSPNRHKLHDCDLFLDEGATLFPADYWRETPLWLRKMWAQHRHNGLRIVMLTQDFKAIDINCRRMLWTSYYMHKIIGSRDISPTLPPLVKWTIWNYIKSFFGGADCIWGVYTCRKIDPVLMESDPLIMLSIKMDKEKKIGLQQMKLVGVPKYHFITWHKVNLFDTTQDVEEYEAKRELVHLEIKCGHIGCNFVHKSHKIK